MSARHHCWSDLPADNPLPLISRRRVIGEQAMVSQVHVARGFTLAGHHHPHESLTLVRSGHVPRLVEAHEDSVVLDVFRPPCEATGTGQT